MPRHSLPMVILPHKTGWLHEHKKKREKDGGRVVRRLERLGVWVRGVTTRPVQSIIAEKQGFVNACGVV